MVNRHTALKIRKTHRYLGLFIGVQFLMWTISGLYFSWTDIDEIHGDHFKKEIPEQAAFKNLIGSTELVNEHNIKSLELLEIDNEPYFWINEEHLYNAVSGAEKKGITEQEAIKVAERYMLSSLEFDQIQRIESVGDHHEYRGRPLPAYEISYKTDENLKAYVAIENGAFQTIRHRDWRWFDFLWMTHTMDYQGRDNFNTIILRAFSLLGLITVLSGFLLWYTSSPTIRKLNKNKICTKIDMSENRRNRRKNKKKEDKKKSGISSKDKIFGIIAMVVLLLAATIATYYYSLAKTG